ncbi:hypothetical protein [Ancylobacter lacus]|uniref:hypothetical protein n=1 Tax=Ancylobacter lacus TaxID=2579970 RepID=UPI001BCCE9A3|nr:hypothetical protein [Ancylobacter lacus]MBS7541111.1 hypothetical protein [Ancylobacter lacus]
MTSTLKIGASVAMALALFSLAPAEAAPLQPQAIGAAADEAPPLAMDVRDNGGPGWNGGGPGWNGGGPGWNGGGPGWNRGPGWNGRGPGWNRGGPGWNGGPRWGRGGYYGGGPRYYGRGPGYYGPRYYGGGYYGNGWNGAGAGAGFVTGLALGAMTAAPYAQGGNCGYVAVPRWRYGQQVYVQRWRCW